MAQIIVSVQMVLEEKFVYKHDVHPLRAVGTEGMAAFSCFNQCLRLRFVTLKNTAAAVNIENYIGPRQIAENALSHCWLSANLLKTTVFMEAP